MQREAEMQESDTHAQRDAVPESAPPPRYEAPRVEEEHVAQPVREEAPRVEALYAEPISVEAPRAEPQRTAAPRYEAPRADPREELASAGLQMVETDRSKAAQPLPEPEPVHLGRPRREKPVVPAIAETELVQVETRDK